MERLSAASVDTCGEMKSSSAPLRPTATEGRTAAALSAGCTAAFAWSRREPSAVLARLCRRARHSRSDPD